jgi:hypothetical protein
LKQFLRVLQGAARGIEPSFPERYRSLRGRLLEESLNPRLPGAGVEPLHSQFCTEPASLALLALFL